MQISAVLNHTKYEAFRWRDRAGLPWKVVISIAMAGAVGLLAQLRIPLPFTPVPVTGQTFGVLMAGVLLGKKWGGASLAIYAVLGLAGVPWFNGASSGLTATGGYLIGFIMASFFLGYFVEKIPDKRSFNQMFGLMLFATLVLVYVPGLVWLGIWLNLVKGIPSDVVSLISLGALPFIAGDILKTGLAAALAIKLLPQKSSLNAVDVNNRSL
jgi:biotin transport system substrate-specific component